MSKSLIERISSDKILEICKKVNTYKEACTKLNCGYRYLINALIKLNYYEEFNQKSKMFAKGKGTSVLKKLWIVRDKTGFHTDHKIWCQELFNGNIKANSVRIKQHLILAGLKIDKCECCGITEWNGKPISLQLHHKDGNSNNNSLENLKILCPNCHSQTDNYGSKNIRNKEKH